MLCSFTRLSGAEECDPDSVPELLEGLPPDADRKKGNLDPVCEGEALSVLACHESVELDRDFFGPGSSPKGCWRSLHRLHFEKWSADLQWRIAHRAIAMNRHRVYLDPGSRVSVSLFFTV